MINKEYENLLKDVLYNGEYKGDRTGTGTYSVFGRQMRFNLETEGFPLITTKKVHFKSVVEELAWMLRGDTNIKSLQEKGVTIWNEWSDENGDLGPVYGKQFRNVSSYLTVMPKIFDSAPIDTPLPELISTKSDGKGGVRNLNERAVFGVGYYGDYDKNDPHYNMLVDIWREMIRRCYYPDCKGYKGYGGSGVHVSERWQCFANFQKDARRIPDWELKFEYPDEYSIDKDTRFASNRYDVDTCMWASENVQNANRSNSKYFTAIDPDGDKQIISSIGRMSREHNVNISAIHRCLNGKLKTHHGWSDFQYIEAPEGYITRYYEVDQLKSIIATIKHNPNSRRHIISLWNPSEVYTMALPPCHGNVIQFYVSPSGKLSCSMYQRSVDMFLGQPFNIASYALLLTLIAYETGYTPGEFIWTGGDCHIYSNHLSQVGIQLSREPREFPKLWVRNGLDIFNLSSKDVALIDYDPYAAIKAPVAV